MKPLRTPLVALLAALALLVAVGCGSDPEPTPVPPTATPEPTATPVPPTPEPTAMPDMGSMGGMAPPTSFDVPALPLDATGAEVAEALITPEELACFQSNLSPEELQALLSAPLLSPDNRLSGEIAEECLSQETSILLFLTGTQAAAGGALSQGTLDCMGTTMWPQYEALYAEVLDPAVGFSFLPCLQPEEMQALMASQSAPAPAP